MSMRHRVSAMTSDGKCFKFVRLRLTQLFDVVCLVDLQSEITKIFHHAGCCIFGFVD